MTNTPTSAFYAYLFSMCLTLFSFGNLIAQENDIYELSNLNNTSTIFNNTTEVGDREPFYDLAFNLHPTIYIENGSIKNVYGDDDIKRISLEGVNSFALLSNKDNRYARVELITLILKAPSDLNNSLDLTKFDQFDKLKFVFVKCYFDFKEEDVEKFIKVSNNVRVFYRLVKPS